MERWGAERKHRGSEEKRRTKRFRCFRRFEIFPVKLQCELTKHRVKQCAKEVDRMWLFYPPYLWNFRSPQVGLLETISNRQIYKSFPIGHIYRSDYSDADWINRISMVAKSNTLIPSAGICQLGRARLHWEPNLPPQMTPYQDLYWYHAVSMSENPDISAFKHHLWCCKLSSTHSHARTCSKMIQITGRLLNSSHGQFTQRVCWPPSLAPASL